MKFSCSFLKQIKVCNTSKHQAAISRSMCNTNHGFFTGVIAVFEKWVFLEISMWNTHQCFFALPVFLLLPGISILEISIWNTFYCTEFCFYRVFQLLSETWIFKISYVNFIKFVSTVFQLLSGIQYSRNKYVKYLSPIFLYCFCIFVSAFPEISINNQTFYNCYCSPL